LFLLRLVGLSDQSAGPAATTSNDCLSARWDCVLVSGHRPDLMNAVKLIVAGKVILSYQLRSAETYVTV